MSGTITNQRDMNYAGPDPSSITDAHYSVVEGLTKEASNLPATLDTMRLVRHELLNGVTTPEIEKIAEELAIDKELGLKNQAEKTAEAALEQDIDELTASKDYFQVSKDLLKELFSINKLNMDCHFHNLKSFWRALFQAGLENNAVLMHSIFLVVVVPMAMLSRFVFMNKNDGIQFFGGVGMLGLWVGMGILLVGGIVQWVQARFSYDTLKVDLDITPIKQVNTRIPYGAKLKVLEAKKTGIFEDFVMAQPEFTVGRQEVIPPRFNIDPAILGVTRDKRMFMIVFWDIKHDIEKTAQQIKRFKKFKLPS